MNIDDLKGKFDAGHELTWEDQQDMLAEIDRLRAVLTEIRDDPILVDYIDPPMRRVINRALSPNDQDNGREASAESTGWAFQSTNQRGTT